MDQAKDAGSTQVPDGQEETEDDLMSIGSTRYPDPMAVPLRQFQFMVPQADNDVIALPPAGTSDNKRSTSWKSESAPNVETKFKAIYQKND